MSSSSRRRAIRVFTSASRSCRPTSPCSTASACATGSRRSACRSTASSSSRPSTTHRQFIEFGEAWDKSMPYAWQVRRSELDEILFRNAAAKGARTFEGAARSRGRLRRRRRHRPGRARRRCRRSLARPLRRSTPPGATRCSPTSSAARRRTQATTARRSTATSPARERLPGKLEGNITIFWFEHGWFWFIPLADGTTSIGAVCWPYYLKSRTQAAARVLPRHDRAVPGARGAPRRRHPRRRPRLCDRQLLVRERAERRRALPHDRRRLRVRRPGLLVGRVSGDAERLRRRPRRRVGSRRPARRCRAAARLRPQRPARPARVLVVHLPRHQSDDARVLHGAARIRSASRKR